MKMRKSEHFVRSSSSIAGQTFNVKMTDKLFETLFSTLYKYKEAAALRETVCNAIDAHGMRDRLMTAMASHYGSLVPFPIYPRWLAPRGTPVEVHLPDDYEPWLEIKDYGIGLPIEKIIGEPIPAREDEVLIIGNIVVKEDEIPEGQAVIGEPGFYDGQMVFRSEDGEIIRTPGLYTTLFHSTKEDDANQIGAFGLGSKSPFAVSDSFTVESRYDGKLYRFLMYLNGNRIPTVDLLTKDLDTRDPKPEDTTEFNGLTVKVPVKNSRFRAFQDEMIRLGRVIRPQNRPTVTNGSYFAWQDIDYSNVVGNTYIQPKGGSNTHYAVMGGVSYPIDLSQLNPDITAVLEKFPSSYTFFDLGDLNVPPSREDLSYDEFTRETLNAEFDAMAKNVMAAKMAELQAAAERGPLALYMHKMRLSDMFGSGFRKMIEKVFPDDKRFKKNLFVYDQVPEVKRDYNIEAPFTRINKPFELEVHTQYTTSEELEVDSLMKWSESAFKIALIIDNSNRARNLKIATAKKKYDIVIVLKLDDKYLENRNKLRTNFAAYSNADELKAYFRSWIGDEETTVDYLTFADKFVEVLDGLLYPTDVLFMHEMVYDVPPVEKDPGLYPFEGHRFNFEHYYRITGADASKIIESGQKIIYIECSGRSPIHEIRGRTVNQAVARDIVKTMNSVNMAGPGEDPENLFQFLNAHPYVVLALRKSVPMMKKFPEVFVPIDQVFEMLAKNFEQQMQCLYSRALLKDIKQTSIMANRAGYGLHLMQTAQLDAKRYGSLVDRARLLADKTREAATPQLMRSLRRMSKAPAKKPGQGYMMSLLASMNYVHGGDTDFVRTNRIVYNIFNDCSRMLEDFGFCEMDQDHRPSESSRKYNRERIELYRVMKFLQENYKPTALNPIEDSKSLFDSISKALSEA